VLTPSFGLILRQHRENKKLSQQEIANKDLKLSASYIAMLERGTRGKSGRRLTREQVWYLIKAVEIWPPECDKFLEAAGLDTDRSEREELEIQRQLDFKELWVFSRHILDPDKDWFEVVKNNIVKRHISYRYFTEHNTSFLQFLRRLKQEANLNDTQLQRYLECTLLPRELFLASFAIYIVGADDLYGCGTKPVYGKAQRFYTMHPSEAVRLHEFLAKLRLQLNVQEPLVTDEIRRIYPNKSKSDLRSRQV